MMPAEGVAPVDRLMTSTPDASAQTTPGRRLLDWRRLWPALLLAALLGATWLMLLARGLDLGFFGDLLDYAYHYDRLGISGGMQWLITEHLQRHLLAGLFPAPLAYFFPGQSVFWYAAAFATHYAVALMSFVLADAVLRGRLRWVSFAAALLFAFHPLHLRLNFEFPTIYIGTSALFLALLSLWLYLQYVRRGRRNRWWIESSLAAFAVAIGLYEQTVLFFALHPLIAWFEARYAGERSAPARFLKQAVADSFWFPVVVVAYLYLLRSLFVGTGTLSFRPDYLMGQVAAGLAVEFAPDGFVARVLSGLNAMPLAALAVTVALAALLFWWSSRDTRVSTAGESGHREGMLLAYLMALGGGITLATIVGVAPTSWLLSENPRLIYPSAVGFGYLVAGLLGLLRFRLPTRLIAATAIALLVGAGFAGLLAMQAEYARQQAARQAVLDAVQAAIPDVSDDPLPYIVLYSDAHPSDDLWLYAQDNRSTYLFDLMYGTTGMPFDALYMDVDPADAPAPDVPGSRYQGKFIVVEAEGIYSPLRPFEPIDPSRLVIVEYDSASRTARVVDELPSDILARANIVERAPVEWKTNRALVAPAEIGGAS